MNPITGETAVEIQGKQYMLRYDWSCLAQIESIHGDNPNLFNPDTVADVAAIGLKKNYPDMTAERIKELSPPLVPFAKSVQQAMQFAYFGNESLPEDGEKKSAPKKGGLLRHIKTLFKVG